jgi:hypothetical protein
MAIVLDDPIAAVVPRAIRWKPWHSATILAITAFFG